jgi:hypothetical protein
LLTALVRQAAPVRTRTSVATVLIAVLTAVLMLPQPAMAEPGEDDAPSAATLRARLNKATEEYNNAKGRLEVSRRKQRKMDVEIKDLQVKVQALSGRVGELAAAVYKGSRAGTVTALLGSGSPRELAMTMTTVEYLAHRDYREIKRFVDLRDRLANKRYEIELEVRKQRAELTKMAARKKEILKALIAAGGGDPTGGPDEGAATAEPSPRNSDGSWPPQSCSENDPTTDGCLTPRTLHALQEAREAGFTRYTACYRSASYGEHPRGRACDFAAFVGGFEDQAAYGAAKTYGDNLAGWFVGNANALGVMYVIWYRRIWEPGNGWSSYSGGGSPAGDHTNHVHVSIM